MVARVKINRQEAAKYAKLLALKYVNETVTELESLAKKVAPVRQPNENNRLGGRLRASIGSNVTSSGTKIRGRVGSRVKYARVAHTGASPHVIVPRRKKALVFKWKKAYPHLVIKSGRYAGYVALQRVKHPGMVGTPYLTSPLVIVGTRRGFRVVLSTT